MKIPKTIKVGNLTYKVEYIKDGFEESDFYGRSWTKPQIIKLNPNLKKEHTEETFFHEILHLILDGGAYKEESGNEKLVHHLSASFYQVLRDNNLLK